MIIGSGGRKKARHRRGSVSEGCIVCRRALTRSSPSPMIRALMIGGTDTPRPPAVPAGYPAGSQP